VLDVALLYATYARKTRVYALRVLGPDLRSYADDVSQDAWLNIMRGGWFPDLLEPPHPEHSRLRFLFVVVRRCASRIRRQVARETAKGVLVRDGEQLTAGRRVLTRRKCGVCGRPTTGRLDLCEAHYTRLRRGTETGEPVQIWRKLSDENVAAIRARLASGETGASLAREFGVGNAQVSRIKHRTRR